jgi:hypothetical protein
MKWANLPQRKRQGRELHDRDQAHAGRHIDSVGLPSTDLPTQSHALLHKTQC